MMPLGLFANRSFTGAQEAAFAISPSFFAMFFYATIYVQAILVWHAVETPAVLLEGIARSCTPAGLDIEGSLKGVQVEGEPAHPDGRDDDARRLLIGGQPGASPLSWSTTRNASPRL